MPGTGVPPPPLASALFSFVPLEEAMTPRTPRGSDMPKTAEQKRGDLLSITDLAIRNSSTYRAEFDRVTRGEYGRPVRIGSRLFVPDPDPKHAA
jgi:hypothetical protein